MQKLAIIVTHPIQYYAPVFKLLAKKLHLKVFYTAGESAIGKFDIGFGKEITWDLPLLEGYEYEFLENEARQSGTHHFNGVVNPDAIEKIQSFNPNSILIYGWAYKSHLKILRHFKGKVSVFFRGDSTLLDSSGIFKKFIKKILLNWVYRHVDAAFYVGNANKAYFKYYELQEKQLIFAPHAIDYDRFSRDQLFEASRLRSYLAIPENDILVLFAGKFEPKKNPHLLLQAFIELKLPNIHLLFVGNGVLEKELKDKVDQLSLGSENERIYFMDFQNQTQMPAVYQACDLFCLPSKGPGETWGLAVNEAMTVGKAVLVSDKVGCATDLVRQELNGAIFKSTDLDDLKQKLKTLTENKDTLAQMGKASQQIISDWSFEKQVNAIVKTIQNNYAK